jgi:hypothetical protein
MKTVEISMTSATRQVFGDDVYGDLRWIAKRDYNYEGDMTFTERSKPHITPSGYKCTIVYVTGQWEDDN